MAVTRPAYVADRMSKMPRTLVVALIAASTLAACSKRKQEGASIKIDGSSTVFPISQAVAQEFEKTGAGRVTVAESGSGGGFKKLCAGEIDVADASRPIKANEAEACQKAGIEWVELPIAYDGLAIVVNPKNTFIDKITVDELKKMWSPDAAQKITSWAQVRDGWPDSKLRLFGPGTDSGTFDYFTEAVVGKQGSSRGDFTASEDDNILVQGVSMDENALGYFGLAYFENNKDKLKLVPVDDGKAENGDGGIVPTAETVANGTYQPLSRPLFIYVRKNAAEKPIVKAFVEAYLANAPSLVGEVGYIPFKPDAYKTVGSRFSRGVTGSLFEGKGSQVGMTIDALLKREAE
jgi:phosphate transport system substrate-binding protein